MKAYSYNDPHLVSNKGLEGKKKVIGIFFAVVFLTGVWLALNQKLIFGEDWMSETYDREDWRTNEGNLPTHGAWDLEAHVWKTEYIMKYFPNFQWNPYWYLGMPLLKYYQSGFYIVHWLALTITGLSAAKAATMIVLFGHLLATLLTFYLCWKVSRRIYVSMLCSVFLLANTFISLRSYGWEPITVVFLFLYPLGLALFLKEPLRPMRFGLLLALGLSYLTHPLLWFSLCMFMGLYLLGIAVRKEHRHPEGVSGNYLWQYLGLVFGSILLGAIQFIPQATYDQVTSGSHMGVHYLPYYQVPFNIISLKDFFFDAGNLKGPGPIIMIAFFLLISFAIIEYRNREKVKEAVRLHKHEIIGSLALVLVVMISFYYMELFNIFPMNVLRSIQYHRIIPEFIITGAVLIGAMSNITHTDKQKILYYTMLTAFVIASGIIIYKVQLDWDTVDTLDDKPEMIYDDVEGRISMPYTDQSLSVRNSFTEIPQIYGYYEQGITNAYNDELFSVSSGFHNADLTILYLKAANVGRLYINTQEGERDSIVTARLNQSLEFHHENNSRYGYFSIPIADPSFAQAVSGKGVDEVEEYKPGCRIIFHQEYCGSEKEEFVSTDEAEKEYLRKYVELLETPNEASANMTMLDPEHYNIEVKRASTDTAVVVKMNHDEDFVATVGGKEVLVEKFGPDFMLIRPGQFGSYEIELEYTTSKAVIIGALVSAVSFLGFMLLFAFRKRIRKPSFMTFKRGDMR